MAQLFLDGFHTVPGLEGIDSVTMAQIMKPGVFQANGGDNLFEVIVDRAVLQVFPEFIRKNKVERVVPRWSCRKPPFHLLYPLSFQNPDDTGGNGYYALLPVFRLIKENISAVAVGLLNLVPDREQPSVQINVRPPQTNNFRLPQPGKQVNDENPLEAVPLDSLQKPGHIIVHDGGKVWTLDFRQLDMVCRIAMDDPGRHSLI